MRAFLATALIVLVCGASPGARQHGESGEPTGGAQPMSHAEGTDGAWHVSFDGALFAGFNHQGGRRGANEVRSQNWFMVMGNRAFGRQTLTLTGMFSLEPLTAGQPGYAEILQEGEAYHGLQITDRQHAHDLFMQLAAAWRIPLTAASSLTIAGGPVGEPALGPVAFMHRPSSAENPSAPLTHHIFDSTHIVMGVVTARLDHKRVSLEGSAFHGREPDEHRYDLDLGPLDSWSVRAWLRPAPGWTVQVSHGFLHEPEQLEPGDQRRTSGSVSWFGPRADGFTAVTAAIGETVRPYSTLRGVLAEATRRSGRTSLYGRFEWRTVETEILLFPGVVHRPHPAELVDPIQAATAGAVRDVVVTRRLAFGLGGDVTFYGLPPLLQVTHGAHPISMHLFVRVSPASWRNRMWNATMAGSGEMHHPM